MKKMKKIMAAAIAMMTFSTAAAVTGTVAWFTASNIVTASGMSIQADTEQGILIANEGFATWKDSVTASHNGEITDPENAGSKVQAKFIPTSTFDATKWYHANSSDYNSAEASQASDNYAALSGSDIAINEDGVYKINKTGLAVTDKNIYLLNKFYLKSSTVEDLHAEKLYVNKVTATVTGTEASVALNKALRVLVTCEYNSVLYKAFFAPFESSESNPTEIATYKVGGVDSQTYTPESKEAKNKVLIDGTALAAGYVVIPGSATADLSTRCISVYCYFEGEDGNCKSANITATLDKLALEIKFGTQTIA